MRILIAALFAATIVASGCREKPQPIAITDEAARLSHQALIANLHSDFAMFKSGLIREEGVNLVGASVVSEESGIGSSLTFWWLGWSAEARRTPLSRGLAQLDLIDRLVSSDRRLRVIRSREDLEEVSAEHSTGILICMEGGAALVDDVSRVRTFFDRGVRVISLTHLNNNELGGSGSPSIPLTNLSLQGDAGLTELGRSLLGEMRKYGMVVDLAHASARTFADILAEWSGPVIVSHTAMAAIYPSTRNTTDAQLRAISARDGIVGVLSQTQLLGGKHLSNLADHIVHAVRVAGADHVALGLDLEEIVNVAPLEFPDTRDVPKLTSLLLERGLKPEEVEKVLGLNAFRFFSRVLPFSPGRRGGNSACGSRAGRGHQMYLDAGQLRRSQCGAGRQPGSSADTVYHLGGRSTGRGQPEILYRLAEAPKSFEILPAPATAPRFCSVLMARSCRP